MITNVSRAVLQLCFNRVTSEYRLIVAVVVVCWLIVIVIVMMRLRLQMMVVVVVVVFLPERRGERRWWRDLELLLKVLEQTVARHQYVRQRAKDLVSIVCQEAKHQVSTIQRTHARVSESHVRVVRVPCNAASWRTCRPPSAAAQSTVVLACWPQ